MAEQLTIQQKAAVENRGGKLLVSAAAGSGKTKVLVDRLMMQLCDPVDPANLDEFLIITYTKAAASELRGKIAAKLTERIAQNPENRHLQRQMQRLFLTKISTVHGFCGDILREYAYRLELSADFRVAEESECQEIRQTVLTELLDRTYAQTEANEDFRSFVDTQGLGRDDRLVSEIILKVYDSARCHLDPDGWLESCLKAVQVENLTDAGQTIWGDYLMKDLFSYLDEQIRVMERCARLAEQTENLEKPAALLRDNLYQLKHLRQSSCWDEIVARKEIDYGRISFPRKNVDTELIERIKACRDACKKGVAKYLRSFADDSAQVLEDLKQSAAAARGLIWLVRQFSTEYDRAKASRRVLDFSDLEHKTLDLLQGKKRTGPTATAREIGQRFREIMVDEYQDSNQVQDAIFTSLTEQKQNCFMVGDVKQSIYQFRLADPDIFLKKYEKFAPAEQAQDGQGRKILLCDNFRSGGEVIEAVNDVFQSCMSPTVGDLAYTEDEMLREGGKGHIPLPGSVELYGIPVVADKYPEEAAFTARKIQQMLDGKHMIREGMDGLRPIRPSDIVILLRSPGSQSDYYQKALASLGIRCCSGGGTDLLETQEIGTLRSLLQTIANPRQDIPLLGTLASPIFGFSANDLAAIRGKCRKGSIYDALMQDDSPKTRMFLQTLEELRKQARRGTLAELIEEIFARTRMDSIYAAMPGGESKQANLLTFYQLAADYESVKCRDLNQFLDYLLTQEEKGLKTEGENPTDCVTIMSIHKSKGLEFPVVFLGGLSREFNRESLRAQVLCDKKLGLGLSVADVKNRVRYPSISKRAIVQKTAAQSLSEELRVLYVAMTRAKDRLIMTYAAKSLETDLAQTALRLDISGGELLAREVSCPGQWVLQTAMQRTEAGEFFALAGKPDKTHLSDMPWVIRVEEAPELSGGIVQKEEKQPLPLGSPELLAQGLEFHYAHIPATMAPSKQTATQRKGRTKDQEAAENAQEPKQIHRSWRKPGFVAQTGKGKAYGSAIHAVMQYIDFDACDSMEKIREEVRRLTEARFITSEQARMVDCDRIASFFESDFGKKLRNGTPYLREFKFSILDDGTHYGQGLEGESVLLQGVVDCALLEPDGITIVDFKTDYVTKESLDTLCGRYRPQVETYAHALGRIYRQPIKATYLYFFHLNQMIRL